MRSIEKHKSTTAAELAKRLKIPVGHASQYLMRYFRLGLLHREPLSDGRSGRRLLYSLSSSGVKKLKYFVGKKKQ